MSDPSMTTDLEEGTGVPSTRAIGRSFQSGLKMVQVRLRIPAVLLIVAVVIGRWEVIRNYWDRLTTRVSEESAASHAVSSDTEYFCPMDPGVVSDWPGKCGACNMALVRRMRGEAVALPDGVVARMQISPYRIQLAGIQVARLNYQPLERTHETAGLVRRDRNGVFVIVAIPIRAAPWIAVGQTVEIRCKDLPESSRFNGRIKSLTDDQDVNWGERQAVIDIDDPEHRLPAGLIADLKFRVLMSTQEPFRSLPTDAPPLKPGESRRLFTCPDHPNSAATKAGRCPIDSNELIPILLEDHQRIRWWCPMHPSVTSDHPDAVCKECNGMILRPRAFSFQPRGKVLAVPESAVIDTGGRTVVFLETMPGMFDGVEVALGPRCGDFFPVIGGLEAGRKVAISGAFLLDAETRLNPSLAASYFGATRNSALVEPPSGNAATVRDQGSPLDQLDVKDRALAGRQRICPVTKKALGSMGVPTRVTVSGRVVFLCCEGCEGKLRDQPEKYLANLPSEPRP